MALASSARLAWLSSSFSISSRLSISRVCTLWCMSTKTLVSGQLLQAATASGRVEKHTACIGLAVPLGLGGGPVAIRRPPRDAGGGGGGARSGFRRRQHSPGGLQTDQQQQSGAPHRVGGRTRLTSGGFGFGLDTALSGHCRQSHGIKEMGKSGPKWLSTG